jgi:hypothetical protein
VYQPEGATAVSSWTRDNKEKLEPTLVGGVLEHKKVVTMLCDWFHWHKESWPGATRGTALRAAKRSAEQAAGGGTEAAAASPKRQKRLMYSRITSLPPPRLVYSRMQG